MILSVLIRTHERVTTFLAARLDVYAAGAHVCDTCGWQHDPYVYGVQSATRYLLGFVREHASRIESASAVGGLHVWIFLVVCDNSGFFFFHFLDLGPEPGCGDFEHRRRMSFFAQLVVELDFLERSLESGVAFSREEVDVGRPVVETVEDVRGVHDGGTSSFGFFPQPKKKILPDDDVEAGSDFVEEKNIERANEAEEELDSTPLPVRDLVHSPVEVDAENFQKLVAALRICCLKFLHHVSDANVGLKRASVAGESHGAHAPLRVEVGPRHVQLQITKGVGSHHLDRFFRLGQVLAGKDAE